MKGADFYLNNNYLVPEQEYSAGRYEFVGVESINYSLGVVTLRSNLVNTYDTAQSVQLVRVPTYQSAVVTDTLTCSPWNGSSGGILALFVNDTLELKGPIDVTGKGFRGVDTTVYTGICDSVPGQRNYLIDATDSAGLKGEGMIWSYYGSYARGY
jgi:hypothetical protein